MTIKTHWHVGHNMPGYLPESDVHTVRTKTEAVATLIGDKEFVLNGDYEGVLRFHGNARTDLGYWMEDTSQHHLGINYWADECTCEEGEETLREENN